MHPRWGPVCDHRADACMGVKEPNHTSSGYAGRQAGIQVSRRQKHIIDPLLAGHVQMEINQHKLVSTQQTACHCRGLTSPIGAPGVRCWAAWRSPHWSPSAHRPWCQVQHAVRWQPHSPAEQFVRHAPCWILIKLNAAINKASTPYKSPCNIRFMTL